MTATPVPASAGRHELTGQQVSPVVLCDEEHHAILTTQILPAWTRRAIRQHQPVAVVVGGQPGSGKSTLARLLHQVLDHRGGAVRISSDLYKRVHPAYEALLAEDDRTAGIAVRPDTRRWQAEVEEHVRRHRYDAVVETALSDPAGLRDQLLAYRAAGYRVELVVLATPEAWSQLGLVDRYVRQVHTAGSGRWVWGANHDESVRGLVSSLAAVEDERLVDRLMVMRRDTTPLYVNELMDGAWRRPCAAARVVLAEQTRWWSAAETWRWRRSVVVADDRVHHPQITYQRRLALRVAAERAAALAEPVRRVAQITQGPPHVDYHRLSAAEHRWIFENLIVPSYLKQIVAQHHPVAVYVMAQPGAGKTEAALMVRRALRTRGAIRLVSDDFKAQHPDYGRLLEDNPRGAGSAIRADYRAWQAEAEAYIRERGGDVIIEIAPGDLRQFTHSAGAFRDSGYRVELVVLAVRAADSRQGTAARYARVSGLGLPARFTTAGGHDRCYEAVAEAVQAAEQQQLVDSIVVMRRDGEAIYRNDHSADGAWVRPLGAAAALAAERHRPYTEAEARRFLAVHEWLARVLPQHRAELRAIARLAQPLFPEGLRPPALPQPTAPAALPIPA